MEPRQPTVITGLTEGWAASKTWTPAALLQRFGDARFRVGSDDDGKAVKLRLRDFLWYVEHGEAAIDDNPLYLFDRQFEDDEEGLAALLDDYQVPPYFCDDLFSYVNDEDRPPHRWLIIGPPRSGSALHTDPLQTSAWNALLGGHKRWVRIAQP